MNALPRSIDYYTDADGKKPFIEWLEKQDLGIQTRITTRFKHIEAGNLGKHHGEGAGVEVLIFDFGPGYRVYYGLTENQAVVLLLVGGNKQRQDRDIKLARKYWVDYKRSHRT